MTAEGLIDAYQRGALARVPFIRAMEKLGFTVETCRAMLRELDSDRGHA